MFFHYILDALVFVLLTAQRRPCVNSKLLCFYEVVSNFAILMGIRGLGIGSS